MFARRLFRVISRGINWGPSPPFEMGIGMRLLSSVIMLAILTGSAYADEGRETLNQVVKCADIAVAADRLKCFDATVAKAQAALAAPPAETQTAQTEGGGVMSWFGFARP